VFSCSSMHSDCMRVLEVNLLNFLGYRGNFKCPTDFFKITCQTNPLRFYFIEKVFFRFTNLLWEPKNQSVFNNWP